MSNTPENIHPAITHMTQPIHQLKPHPQNPRKRNPTALQRIQESLTTNGQYREIVARRLPNKTIEILAGHGTVEAATNLGWQNIAAAVHDNISDDAAKRILLADNRTSDLAEYDETALQEILDTLDTLDGTGYLREELNTVNDLTAGDAEIDNMLTVYGVVVECDTEAEQVALLDQLIADGHQVRALM